MEFLCIIYAMTADELKIPQIGLAEGNNTNSNNSVPSQESVLIPKMDLKEEPAGAMGGAPQTVQPKAVQQPVSQPAFPQRPQSMNQTGKGKGGLAMKIGVGIMAFILILIVAAGIPAFLTYQKGMALYKTVQKLEVAAKSQDLSQIKPQIAATQKSLKELKSSYKIFSWTQILPFVGNYVADMGHSINAAEAGM
ncbi:MAG: hypothetical protein WC450_12025, partial [Candidatus Omnitrophota bacterium]